MSPENCRLSSENKRFCPNFTETELTLGIPGLQRNSSSSSSSSQPDITGKTAAKRGFSETVELNLGNSNIDRPDEESGEVSSNLGKNQVSGAGKPPSSKAQVVGWPPVRSYMKNALKSCMYVKVAVDGAPYLRKVDLQTYDSYQQLLSALEDLFSCFTIRHCLNESKLMDLVNGTEYVPTYEDKDGDWMLVGDVPWKMFVESCKRLRLMRSSEALGLATRNTR